MQPKAGIKSIFLNLGFPIFEILVLVLTLVPDENSLGDKPECATIAFGEILSRLSN